MAEKAQSRREKRNSGWARLGHATAVRPERLTFEQVAYASKACGALYQWATVAVDTAKALQSLYPVKQECDALTAAVARLREQLASAELQSTGSADRTAAQEVEVARLRAELARLQAALRGARAAQAAQAESEATRQAELAERQTEEAAAKQAQADAKRAERSEHRKQQSQIEERQAERSAERQAAVNRAMERVEVTQVDVIIKQTLTFEKGQVILEDLNVPALLAVAELMKDHPDLKVNVAGRPDASDGGNEGFQVKLSAERAEAVCGWLVAQGGVSLSRLRTSRTDGFVPPLAAVPVHVKFNVIQEVRINDTIGFGANSPDIRDESTATLDGVALVLNNRTDIGRITVEGHTCNAPSWGYSNQELSEKRAQAVRDYLVEQGGVDPERLNASGFGETRPIKPNDDRSKKAANRRSEFLVY
jgi:chemotaxis protein MotB